MHAASEVTLTTLLALCGASCARQAEKAPVDFRPETLNYKISITNADSIVLAYPISHKEVGRFEIRRFDNPRLPLIETETTLAVLHVFKGPNLPTNIVFRHYQEDDPHRPLIGPPQGPSGKLGERGIFFLRRSSPALFRSVVDIYRPDISTPWIREPVELPAPRERLPDSIAAFLLRFNLAYDRALFLSDLHRNTAISWLLVGDLNTSNYLKGLVEGSDPADVKRGACAELSERYHAAPDYCKALLADSVGERKHLDRAAQSTKH